MWVKIESNWIEYLLQIVQIIITSQRQRLDFGNVSENTFDKVNTYKMQNARGNWK